MLERVWGADPAFLAEHGAEYQRVVEDLHCSCAGDLIVLGRLREARDELAHMRKPPIARRLLTRLPVPLVTLLLELREWLVGWI